MESQHISMSIATLAPKAIEEFELMPHPFGWKAEYYYGQAHFSPRENHVYTNLSLEQREINESCQIVPVEQGCQEQIIAAFFEAFLDSAKILKSYATKEIDGMKRSIMIGSTENTMPILLKLVIPGFELPN